jgi:ketosteroid isomerase-like protein
MAADVSVGTRVRARRADRIALLVGAGALVVGVLLGTAGMATLGRTPANPAEATAGQWLAALQAKDLTAMEAPFAADATWDDGATGEHFTGGPAAESAGWGEALGTIQAVKDAHILALGEGVAVVAYTLHGTPPSSPVTPIDIPFVSVLSVRDGHITNETIYYNPKVAYGS